MTGSAAVACRLSPEGCVPAMNSSLMGSRHDGDAGKPVSWHIASRTIPGGSVNGRGATPRSAAVITSCQIGAAPVMPLMSTIGALSALPTQTPTTRSGV